MLEHVFPNAFEGFVTARLINVYGNESTVKVPLSISPAHVLPIKPPRPENVKVDISLDAPDPIREAMLPLAVAGIAQSDPIYTAILSWDPPADAGGAPVEGYTIRGNNQILGFVGSDIRQATIKNVPQDATFSVEAVNNAGSSEGQLAEQVEDNDDEDSTQSPEDDAETIEENQSSGSSPDEQLGLLSNEAMESDGNTSATSINPDSNNIHQLTAAADTGRKAAVNFASATNRAPWIYIFVVIAITSFVGYALLTKRSRK